MTDAIDYDTGEIDESKLEEEVQEPMQIAIAVIITVFVVGILCVFLNAKQGTVQITIPDISSLFSNMIPSMSMGY